MTSESWSGYVRVSLLLFLAGCTGDEKLVLTEAEMTQSLGKCVAMRQGGRIYGPVKEIAKHPAAGRLSWVVETSDNALIYAHPRSWTVVDCPVSDSASWQHSSGMTPGR